MFLLRSNKYCRAIFGILAGLQLSSCATPLRDDSFEDVKAAVEYRIPQTPVWFASEEDHQAQQDFIANLLANPLTPDTCVQIAFLNNLGLQAQLASLGIQAADLAQAYRLPNPGFVYAGFNPVQGEYNRESQILFDLLAFLIRPLRIEIESFHLEKEQCNAAIQILMLAAETKKAYFNAVAAEQACQYWAKLKTSTQASAQLAKALKKVGNYSALQAAREQAIDAQLSIAQKKAQILALKAREQLARLMGVTCAENAFQLPVHLPPLPNTIAPPIDIENVALCERLDLQMAQSAVNATAQALGLTRKTRFINVLDLGYGHNDGTSIAHQNGYIIGINVPLFDWGDAKIDKAEQIYMQAVWRLREKVVNAQSEVREVASVYQMTYDLAKHYQANVLPLYDRIMAEDQLRYNGMLISTFDLLLDQRDQMMTMISYIEALRDFWMADTDVCTTVTVKSPYQN